MTFTYTKRGVREARVEAAFVRALARAGVLSIKLNLWGNRGWPDRLVFLPGGRVVFVELKRPGGQARALQVHVHARLRALGFQVAVYDDAAAAAAFIRTCKTACDDPVRAAVFVYSKEAKR